MARSRFRYFAVGEHTPGYLLSSLDAKAQSGKAFRLLVASPAISAALIITTSATVAGA